MGLVLADYADRPDQSDNRSRSRCRQARVRCDDADEKDRHRCNRGGAPRLTVAFVEVADDDYEIDDASHPNALLRLRDFETGEVREIGIYTYEEAWHLADLHGQKYLDREQPSNRLRQ